MLKTLVQDQARLKVALRYANAVRTVLSIIGGDELPSDLAERDLPPKGSASRIPFRDARKVLLEMIVKAAELEVALPTSALCLSPGCGKVLRRVFKIEVDVDEAALTEEVIYRDFTIKVFEHVGRETPYRYQPVILKDGEPVHQVFVRSKTPAVSIEHFAKRAIDQFVTTGTWPDKRKRRPGSAGIAAFATTANDTENE